MDKLQYDSATKVWREQFSFLNITGLNHVYLTLLALATGKGHIGHLHSALPANQQIFRSDLLALEDFWKKYIQPDFDQNLGLSPSAADWFLTRQADQCETASKLRPQDNTRYYFDYIRAKRQEPQGDLKPTLLWNEFIFGQLDADGENSRYFLTDLQFGKEPLTVVHTFEVNCFLSQSGRSIIAQLVAYSHDLTEQLAYFIGQLPGYVMKSEACGSMLDLSYALPAAGLMEHLTPYIAPAASGVEYYIADRDFLIELGRRLKNLGIPLDQISPIS
jgi:hypothetical protein